jgi:hypothetical protein
MDPTQTAAAAQAAATQQTQQAQLDALRKQTEDTIFNIHLKTALLAVQGAQQTSG